MEKSEFKALVERYKNEMIERFNLKRNVTNDNVVEALSDSIQNTQPKYTLESLEFSEEESN